MTKIHLLLAFFLLVSLSLSAQNQEKKLLIEEYIRQSEKQKKTGMFLLGAGLGAVIIGGGIASVTFWSGDESSFTAGSILFTAGSVSTLISIPILISSASNGRKAGRLSLVTSQLTDPQAAGLTRPYPALSFSFPLTSKKP